MNDKKQGRPKGSKNKPKRGRPKNKKEPKKRGRPPKSVLPSQTKIESKIEHDSILDSQLSDEKFLEPGYVSALTNQTEIFAEPVDTSYYYRGSKNIPIAGAQFKFTQAMADELTKCKSDVVYFAENFFYIVNLDEGKQKIKLYDAQKNMLLNMVNNRFTVNLASRQSGKALSLDTPIATVTGRKTIGELTTNDIIFGSDGSQINITHIHPIEYNRPCYRVIFDSGEVVVADEQHEWFTHSIQERRSDESGSIKTTKQIFDTLKASEINEPNHRIPISYDANFKDRELVTTLPLEANEIKLESNAEHISQKGAQFHYIVNIEPCESVPVRCITVDSDDSLFLIGNSLIPTHNSTLLTIFVLWMTCFCDDHRAAIVANKEATAINIFKRVRMAYEQLPNYIKPGVKDYGKTGVTFANDSSIVVSTTTATSIRGDSLNTLAIDEVAFIESHILEEFWSSVIPAISSGKKTKILLVSTPNGVGNKFYEIYSGAENGTLPSWSASRIDWWDKPGRDEKWKSDQIQLLGSEEKFLQEFANAFLDSYSTAVGSDIIERFKKTKKEPIWSSEDGTYIVFEPPNPSRMYAIGVDVGEGIGRAASVAQILDVTDLKQIEQVAIYTSPVIEPFHFANKLKTIAESWGIPPMLIERNNCGAQVIDALHYTHQYEKIVGHSKVSEKDRYNKTRCLGVLSHHNIKFDGIQNMRYWINHLQCVKINDSATISEFETFVRFPHGVFKKRNDSFFDDRVMSLVWALFILEPTICEQYFQIDNFDNQQKPAAISNNNYWGVDLENFILRDLDSRAEIFTPPVEQQVNQQSSSLIKFSEKELNKLDLFNLTMEDLVEEGYTPFNFD